ncbi:MAG: acyl-CoA desaturase [Acidobacteria bacterium]|nr:acyl-CoA desaturase [Acidobacteriota bacterium]
MASSSEGERSRGGRALAASEGAPEAGGGIDWLGGLPFLGVHAACLAVVWTGVSPVAIAVGALTLLTRMFGLTAGYHRYFCHRSFRTTRAFQFVLAWLGASAAQMGPLWWAGHHRSHHRHSDTGDDVHSPSAQGFLVAHFGWILSRANQRTKAEWVPDLLRFPELRWLDRNHYLAPLALGATLFALGEWLAAARPALGTSGAQLVVVALFWSTTVLYHLTFAVNSLAHRYGRRRYETDDHSRNLWWLAVITAGEGWHNNHHRYPASERQGFYWWECDLTHYAIVVLSWLGIVWEVRGPAAAVLEEGAGRPSRPVRAASRPAWR